MYFKNAKVYLLSEKVDFSVLPEALAQFPFHPCGPHTIGTLGFAPVIGELLVHEVQGLYTVKLLKESKILPPRVVTRELEKKASAIELETGAPLGKKARSDLKESVINEMLPRAFTDQAATLGTIIPEHDLIFVNASSDSEAEIFLAVLRKALGTLPVLPFAHNSLSTGLTSWLSEGQPESFQLLEEAELQAMDDTKSTIRAKNQELSSEEIQSCLDSGKMVQKLAVEFDEQLTAVLCEDGSIKRIKFSERLIEETLDIPKDQQAALLDAEIVLGANALKDMVLELKQAFNLGVENVTAPESF